MRKFFKFQNVIKMDKIKLNFKNVLLKIIRSSISMHIPSIRVLGKAIRKLQCFNCLL